MKRPVAVIASFLSIVFALLTTAYAGSPVVIPVGSYPRSVVVNPVTNRVYVTNNGDTTVSVIDGSTNTVVATVTVGVSPNGIDVDLETNTVYVANYNANTHSFGNRWSYQYREGDNHGVVSRIIASLGRDRELEHTQNSCVQ